MNGNKIPQTDSIQELADFWDTHDLTDFDAELEEVDEPVFDRQTTAPFVLSRTNPGLSDRLSGCRGSPMRN